MGSPALEKVVGEGGTDLLWSPVRGRGTPLWILQILLHILPRVLLGDTPPAARGQPGIEEEVQSGIAGTVEQAAVPKRLGKAYNRRKGK